MIILERTYDSQPNINQPQRTAKKKKKLNLSLFGYSDKGRVDMPFFVLVIALLTVGLIMMFSASFVSALYNTPNHDSLYYIKRQLIFAVAGVFFTVRERRSGACKPDGHKPQ